MTMHLKRRWINRQVYEYFSVNVLPLLKRHEPILVYQMGKVGSSSIRNSLFRCADPRTSLVLMSHEFFPVRHRDPNRIDIEPEYRRHVMQEIEHDKRVFERLSWRERLSLRFREKFYSGRIYNAYVRPGGPLRVITLVREPVANNISMFFQLFEQYTGTTVEQSTQDINTFIQIFLDRYMHTRPLTWFDAELKTTLGIDVYRQPFPVDQGYDIVSDGNIAVLVLKCELDDSTKAKAIADFLGLDRFELVRSNVASNKTYAEQYTAFKQRIRVPEPLLDEMYESKFARFFYSDDERGRFRAHWSGGNNNP
jgi:hypothetical protein